MNSKCSLGYWYYYYQYQKSGGFLPPPPWLKLEAVASNPPCVDAPAFPYPFPFPFLAPKQPPQIQLWDLGSAVSSPSGSRQIPVAKRFWSMQRANKRLSWHYKFQYIKLKLNTE
jgi:hypothetical protein